MSFKTQNFPFFFSISVRDCFQLWAYCYRPSDLRFLLAFSANMNNQLILSFHLSILSDILCFVILTHSLLFAFDSCKTDDVFVVYPKDREAALRCDILALFSSRPYCLIKLKFFERRNISFTSNLQR